MRNKLLVMGVCWTIALVPASALQAGPNGEVCRQIVFACLDAGFIQGGAKRGNGLWMNCISPIMQGKGLQRASMPLPRLSPRVVSACRASNPTFGQPKARERYVTQGIVRPATPANDGSEITLPDKKPAVPVVPKASEPAVGTSDVAPQTDGDVKMATQPGLGKPDGAATAKHAIVADQDAAPSSSDSSGYTQTSPAPANADAADLKMTTQTAALDPKKELIVSRDAVWHRDWECRERGRVASIMARHAQQTLRPGGRSASARHVGVRQEVATHRGSSRQQGRGSSALQSLQERES